MIPLNTQPIEKQDLRQDGALDVVRAWFTLQGEGPFSGMPAIFVRLAGCDLLCPGCDTDYTSTRQIASVSKLNETISRLLMTHKIPRNSYNKKRLVVITGGEPFRQNISPFVRSLIQDGLAVQVETNGTLSNPDFPWFAEDLSIVCSPKTPQLDGELKEHICALKYVVAADNISEKDGLPLTALGNTCGVARPWNNFAGEIYVQPQDDQDPTKNKANTEAAVQSCMKFGYTLSLQIHKLVGVD